jgi:DNA primase
MHDSAKYLIHADITASGVVERNDVVGAIFGQTEGLLGEDLDLRELQDHSKVGRIDVDVDSEGGQSFGEITIASGLDRVETALLAASLETIERVGPCRATIEVSELEDVRSAKRRAVVERATDLLAELEDESVTSVDIVDEVRQRVRVENVTDYEGYPAGPRVADSDAIIVVEGRADVLQLLQYGVKNAVAVEGTDVPQPVADLTKRRTVTAFLDGDRGGDLILKELAQVGSVDYVAFAPAGTSVEDLSRGQITAALREKVSADTVLDASDARSLADPASPGTPDASEARDDGSADPASDDVDGDRQEAGTDEPARADGPMATSGGGPATAVETASGGETAAPEAAALTEASTETDPTTGDPPAVDSDEGGASADTAPAVPESQTGSDSPLDAESAPESDATDSPDTVAGHVDAVIAAESDRVHLLDGDATAVAEGAAEDAFDLVESADAVPTTVVLDGPVTQRVLDVAAQRGVERIVGASEGEFVKRPTDVRVRTIEDF